jgi:hypothetical protein
MVGALVGFGHCTRLLGSGPWEVIGFTHTMAEHLAACPQLQPKAIFNILRGRVLCSTTLSRP